MKRLNRRRWGSQNLMDKYLLRFRDQATLTEKFHIELEPDGEFKTLYGEAELFGST